MKWRIGLLISAVVLAVGCRVRDVRTFEIYVPKMQNQACVAVIEKALAAVPLDPSAVKIDLDRRVVTATYDSLMMSRKNIEFAIADVGFEANGIPANHDAEAALSADCKAPPAKP